MVKVGKWIARHRVLMLIVGFLLIIPSVIGMAETRVNYDLLSYLPEHLETVKVRIFWWMSMAWEHFPWSWSRTWI